MDRFARFIFFAALSVLFGVCLFCGEMAIAQEKTVELKLLDNTVVSGYFRGISLLDHEGTEHSISIDELPTFVRNKLSEVLERETARLKAKAEIGTILEVIDGDTFRFQGEAGKTRAIRLHSIDAPELNQPFGKEAAKYLADLVKNKTVSIIVRRLDDKYRRDIADLYVNDLWIVGHLVENGYAWNYVAYSDSDEIVALEKAARKAKRGLWADSTAVAPWIFRKLRAVQKEEIRSRSVETLRQTHATAVPGKPLVIESNIEKPTTLAP
jgi:endonuclease YncB( thermonuclease family)